MWACVNAMNKSNASRRAKKTKSNRVSRNCSTCKHVIKAMHFYDGGQKHYRPDRCKLGNDITIATECFDVEPVQPYRVCAECKTRTRDNGLHKGRYLCRDCLCGDYTPSYEVRWASPMGALQDHGMSNINWSLLNRKLGEAMDREGIPRPGFNRREDHQEEWGTVYQGSGK